MKCQILFAEKNSKEIVRMSSAENFAQHAKHYASKVDYNQIA